MKHEEAEIRRKLKGARKKLKNLYKAEVSTKKLKTAEAEQVKVVNRLHSSFMENKMADKAKYFTQKPEVPAGTS